MKNHELMEKNENSILIQENELNTNKELVKKWFKNHKFVNATKLETWKKYPIKNVLNSDNFAQIVGISKNSLDFNNFSTHFLTELLENVREIKNADVLKFADGLFFNYYKYIEAMLNPVDADDYGTEILFQAVINNNIKVLEFLIAKGADVDVRDKNNATPLLTAVNNGNINMVKYLITKGANANIRGKDYITPVSKAINDDNIEIAKFLIENEADVDAKDIQGHTPLVLACKNASINMIKLLIKEGAKVDLQDKKLLTLLLKAVSNNDLELVKCVIENDINILDKDGFIMLSQAFNIGNHELIKFLIEKGADIDVQDRNGFTLLLKAVNDCNTELAKFLIEKGADIDVQDQNGFTLLLKAVNNNNFELVKLLIENTVGFTNKPLDSNANLEELVKDIYLEQTLVNNDLKMELLLKYLEEKGYDTQSTYITGDDTLASALKTLVSSQNDYAINLINRGNDGHWNMMKVIQNNLNIKIIFLDSLGQNPNENTILKPVKDVLTYDQLQNVDVYHLNYVRQYSGKGCGVFTFKDLKYVLKVGTEELLEQIVKSCVPETKYIDGIRIKAFTPPPEMMKLLQSMNTLGKYTTANKDNLVLNNKIILSGVKLEAPITIEEYIKSGRDKYGVKTPHYVNNKLQNNLKDFFDSKYKIKADEIVTKHSVCELKNIVEKYQMHSNLDELNQLLLHGNIIGQTVDYSD